MRSTLLIFIAVIILFPTLPDTSFSVRFLNHLRVKRVQKAAVSTHRQILDIVAGCNYLTPKFSTTMVIVCGSTAIAWFAGFTLLQSFSIGLLIAVLSLIRTHNTTLRRRKELQSYWPILLDQIRSTMLSSRRALQYVIFDQTYIGSQFLNELIQFGKREFETSGSLENSLAKILEEANDPCTSEVCASLIETCGHSTSQIESQLNNIISSIRSRNELAEEAESKLAGVKMARLFIILIPVGMALVGIAFAGSVSAFETPTALAQELTAFLILAMCWFASNLLMKFPKSPVRIAKFNEPESEVLK